METPSFKKVADQEVNVNDVSRISAATIIKGEVSSENDIRVDGKVDGKLFSKGKIVVGDQAQLKGTLACNNVDFWGKMEGDIFVKELLTLKGSAEVTGSIHVNKLQVEVGAQINGTCQMIAPAEYEKAVESVITTKLPVKAAAPAPAKK